MHMKNSIIIALISLLTFTNCSLNSDDNTNATPQVITIYWNLVNVSGGFAGVDDDFEIGTIIWRFNELTETLNVDNGNTDDTKQDGLDSGNYSFSLLNVGQDTFLIVDSEELGNLTITGNQLVINQNETSGGSAADGFIYTFTKSVEIE